ncbi:hypothetical protein Pmani_028498 [Petrolisthes manimaculis]|uniref:Protein kinase domain-containing protein n=1 Tax=Petrolisthes manimaculis TaxID=1843537 RepID=A0AAE1NZE8_9EUCA|nr:hypothetical protein Pmani_028498 [Petrolisthes manimaculis]
MFKKAQVVMGNNPDPVHIFRKTRDILDDTERIQELGRGAYGVASLTKYRETLTVTKVAVKATPSKMRLFLKEAMIMYHMKGAGGTPRLLAMATDYPLMVMSVCRGCHFDDFKPKPSVSNLAKFWMSVYNSLAQSLSEIHATNCLHRDLKENNILMYHSNQEGDIPKANIIDFGLAIMDVQDVPTKSLDLPPLEKCTYMGSEWISPELHFNKISSYAADVFSLGQIIRRSINREKMKADLSKVCVAGLDELVQAMTTVQPCQRPSLTYVCKELKRLLLLCSPKISSKSTQTVTPQPHHHQQNITYLHIQDKATQFTQDVPKSPVPIHLPKNATVYNKRNPRVPCHPVQNILLHPFNPQPQPTQNVRKCTTANQHCATHLAQRINVNTSKFCMRAPRRPTHPLQTPRPLKLQFVKV